MNNKNNGKDKDFDFAKLVKASAVLKDKSLSKLGEDVGHKQTQISNVLAGRQPSATLENKLETFAKSTIRELLKDMFGNTSRHFIKQVDSYFDNKLDEHREQLKQKQ